MSSSRVATVALFLCISGATGYGSDAAPPFGTLLRQWDLQLSGSAVGAGLTWRGESARVYLIDQGYAGAQAYCRSFRPEDPVNSLRDERWQFPDLGAQGTKDVPQGIAWDSDSNCFWVSVFIDNSSSSCCLLRMSETGVWTGDSWALPAGDFVYVRGIDYSADLSTFYGGGSWSSEAGLARFNPYTGVVLARVVKGATTAAGCVPADSNYIITTRGSYLLKLSSTGGVLESVPVTSYMPYDVAVVVPDVPAAEDTVCFFAMTRSSSNTLQLFSAGMNWGQLSPTSRRNIRPIAILAPVGAPDSGTLVTPRVVVRNTGVEPADLVRVWYKVDHHGTQRYLDSTRIVNMPPRSADTIEFAPWRVTGRDSMTGVVWVYWAGDSIHRDDTLRNRFLARVRDAGVRSVLAPSDTLDSGVVVTPTASVWNFGNARESIPVGFVIKGWSSLGSVFVNPGGARTVTAANQYVTVPGAYVPCYRSLLAGDMHPENDAVRDTFWVRGTVAHDVALSGPEPRGRVDTTMTVVPACTIANRGSFPEACRIWFELRDPTGALVVSESLESVLGTGAVVRQAFAPQRLRVPGQYVAKCSTYTTPDQNMLNDQLVWEIEVVTGLEEQKVRSYPTPGVSLTPSIVTGTSVELSYSLGESGASVVRLCDVSGRTVLRRVVNLWGNGRLLLDLSGMSAGLYWVRLEGAGRTVSARLVLGEKRR